MKTQQTTLQRTKPSPTNDQSSNQSVRNSQTPKNFQKHNHNSTLIDSDIETLRRNLQSHHEPSAPPAKLSIHRSETRTNGETSNRPIESRANSKELQESDRKLERTVENWKLPIKTHTNGRKLEFTEQKLEQTMENGCTSTQPHRKYINLKNSRCGWGQVLHGPTVGA